MSPTVAFPDFATSRQQRGERSFVCTLHMGDAVPAWVHVAGDLDVRSSPRLRRALEHADTPSRLVVLDLRGLTSIDSSGVDVIVDAAARARQAARRLMILRGVSQVDHVLAERGAFDILDVIELDPPDPVQRMLPRIANTNDAA